MELSHAPLHNHQQRQCDRQTSQKAEKAVTKADKTLRTRKKRDEKHPAKCRVRGPDGESLDRVSCRQTEKAVAKADKTLRNCQNAEET